MQIDLEHVLDCALDGVFIVSKGHRLVLFNRACEELFGVYREDVVEKVCWKLEGFEKSWKLLGQRNGRISYGELASKKERMVLPHKNGKQVWVETIFTPIHNKDTGELTHVMGVIKDITELKRIELEKNHLINELDSMRRRLDEKYDFSNIICQSKGMLHALKLAAKVAGQNTTVMLLGESGTGKELVAKSIHFNSARNSKSFIAVNCAAFPETLIESELFGYEKGAFTGAEKAKPGKISLANGGTLFLDEINEMSLPVQAKILRAIQEREFDPLGGVKACKADIRVIAATNKNLEEWVKDGRFRKDLFYRLFVYPIEIPPLRNRREDIPVLAEHFLHRYSREMDKIIDRLSPEAESVLYNYDWPGNVRELQNVLERLVVLTKNRRIGIGDLPRYIVNSIAISREPAPRNEEKLGDRISRVENEAIVAALKKCGNNQSRAARHLGLSRSTLRYKISKMFNRKPAQG